MPRIIKSACHPLRGSPLALLLWAFALITACDGGDNGIDAGSPTGAGKLRIYHSPYSEVDWTSDQRLKSQHHDHLGATAWRLDAYDKAGYNVVPLMDYSGAPKYAYSLTYRLWPAETWVPPVLAQGFNNIKLLYPNAEEIGDDRHHVTSPFLTNYLEYSPKVKGSNGQTYRTVAQLVKLITDQGGMAVFAHAWDSDRDFDSLPPAFGMEIFNAYAEVRRQAGDPAFTQDDRNARLVANWDRALRRGRNLIGIAVNDHYGPDVAFGTVDERFRDSGKIIVLSKATTLGDYRDAFGRGAVLAIRDFGVPKDHYPRVNAISVEATSILVDVEGATAIRWVSMGRVVGSEAMFEFSSLPRDAKYLRAEISDAAGSVVYTQAFTVRPVGDADGNGRVTIKDTLICEAVAAGTDTHPDRIGACTQQ